MELPATIGTAIACSATTSSLAVWVFKQWISEQLKSTIQHMFNEKLERFRAELRNSEVVR